jgi:predicted GNAT family N-acyltransferase
LVAGIPLVLQKFSTPLYQGINIFSRPITKEGLRVLEPLGFSPGARYDGLYAPHLQMLDRSHELSPTVVAEPVDQVTVQVVRSMDEMARVMAIRSAVYIGEQRCPFEEEFDGNDFSATHLICHRGREPVGCLRIRYFADFAKLERLAVVRRHRRTRLSFKLIEAGIAFCRAKGYRRLYGHAEPRVCKLWERFGFRPRTPHPTLSFSNLEFVVGDLELPIDFGALNDMSDPYVLVRPEGQWTRPGVLDQSAKNVSLPDLDIERLLYVHQHLQFLLQKAGSLLNLPGFSRSLRTVSALAEEFKAEFEVALLRAYDGAPSDQ